MNLLLQPNMTLAFLGASITQYGGEQPNGYIRRIVDCLVKNDVPVELIAAGVSGNTSRDMRARLERDVLSRKPDWMVLDCGRNDVWHGTIPFGEYMENLTAIVDSARTDGVQVILQTISPIGEDLDADFNRTLAYSNAFVRYLAHQKNCVLCEMSEAFHEALRTKTTTENLLTTDGVHLNDRGNRLMARTLLRTFGLSEEHIAETIPAD